MLEPKIKIIFFDVGSVLLARKESFDLLAAKYLRVDFSIYKEKLLEIIESEECKKKYLAITNINQEQQFQDWINRKILLNLDIKVTDEKVYHLSHLRINRTPNYILLEGVFELLDYLKDNYRLGIISNAPPSRRHFELKDFDLEKYFDPIIISGEIGSDKPKEKIFKISLELANAKASESALIDNKLENLQVADKLGFGKCILFNFDKVDQSEFLSVEQLSDLKKFFEE